MRSLAIVLARSASAKRVPHIGPSPDTLPPSRVVIPRSARTARSLARLRHLVCQPPTRRPLLKPEPVVSSALNDLHMGSVGPPTAKGTRVTSPAMPVSMVHAVSHGQSVVFSRSRSARNRSWRNVYRLLLRTHWTFALC